MYSIPDIYRRYQEARERSEPCINLYRVLCVEVESQYNALPSNLLVEYGDYIYETARDLHHSVDAGILSINTDGNEFVPHHPLAAINKEHGVSYNLLLRAVHDFYGHYLTGSGFDWEGEVKAFEHHAKMFSRKLRGVLMGEVLGQAAYVLTTGEFISPQPMVNMEVP